MASLISFTRIILQSLDQASFNILNDNSLKGRTVLKLSFIFDVFVISELVQRQIKQTTKDQGIMIYSILKKKICVSASSFTSAVTAVTNLDRFQSVYKERAAIPYVDHNVAVTTVLIATKTNFSRNDSFVNCWACSVHPPRQVRSISLAF